MKKKSAMESMTGVLVVMVGAVGVFCAWKSYVDKKEAYRTISASFDSVEGLSTGSPVKLNGVIVGSVEHITIDPKSLAVRVDFSLMKDLPTSRDMGASILSESLFGGKVLALTPGISKEMLKDGEVIQSTQAGMSFEGLLQKIFFSKTGSERPQVQDKHTAAVIPSSQQQEDTASSPFQKAEDTYS